MQISDQDVYVVYRATCALAIIAHWLEGAQAMVDAKVQNHILKFQSLSPCTTGRLVQELAGHEPTMPAILELNILKHLVVHAG
jgi:hypothetical protein